MGNHAVAALSALGFQATSVVYGGSTEREAPYLAFYREQGGEYSQDADINAVYYKTYIVLINIFAGRDEAEQAIDILEKLWLPVSSLQFQALAALGVCKVTALDYEQPTQADPDMTQPAILRLEVEVERHYSP